MNPFSAIARFFREIWRAGRLTRQARDTDDPRERVRLLEEAARLDPSSRRRWRLAVARGRAGMPREAADAWREVIADTRTRFPRGDEVEAMEAVYPLVAAEILAALTDPGRARWMDHHWTLQRTGGADDDQQWKLDYEVYWKIEDALPLLTHLAQCIAHTAPPGPGRVTFTCRRYARGDGGPDRVPLGTAVLAWDAARALSVAGMKRAKR